MFAQNAELSISEKHAIRAFVNDLQYERKELVAAAMHYPMERLYPLKPIIDEKEFIEHYDAMKEHHLEAEIHQCMEAGDSFFVACREWDI